MDKELSLTTNNKFLTRVLFCALLLDKYISVLTLTSLYDNDIYTDKEVNAAEKMQSGSNYKINVFKDYYYPPRPGVGNDQHLSGMYLKFDEDPLKSMSNNIYSKR